MEFKQIKKGLLNSEVILDLKETGLNYKFYDKKFGKEPEIEESFISYSNITNQKVYKSRIQSFGEKLFKVLIYVVFLSLLGIFIIVGSNSNPNDHVTVIHSILATVLFILFFCYSFLVKQKVILLKGYDSYFTIFNDKQANHIIEEIYAHRNSYLKKKYFNPEARKTLSTETAEFLFSLKVINSEELEEVSKRNDLEHNKIKVGFNLEEEIK